jgi:hypothetical protein
MVVSQTQLDQVNALVRARFPQYSYVHPQDFLVQATIAANTAAGVQANASITVNGTSATVQNIPQSQVWVIKDIYTTSSGSTATDAQVTFVKNSIKTLTTTAPLSSNLVTNQTRPGLYAPLIYEPNSAMTLPTAPVATAGTTTTTDTFFISVSIYDATYS